MKPFGIHVGASIVFVVVAGCGEAESASPGGAAPSGDDASPPRGARGVQEFSDASTAATVSTPPTGSAPSPTADAGDAPIGPLGESLGPDRTWTWIDVDGFTCRDGSGGSIAVSVSHGSRKLAVFFEGGGACFNAATCAINPANVAGIQPMFAQARDTGILDRTKSDNPIRDWSYVYVPYCTGDVFIGGARDATVPGVFGAQQFAGYASVGAVLRKIVPAFGGATQVLLTGRSAGGFGAVANYDQVATAFDPIPVTLLDDSGPPMGSRYIAPCLQASWRKLWNFDATILDACGAGCPNHDEFMEDFARYLSGKYRDSSLGFLSSTGDSVIRLFYGFGSNDCAPLLPDVPPATYKEGLVDFRDRFLAGKPHAATFFIENGSGTMQPPETTHTWIGNPDRLYTETVKGVRLIDWISDVVAGSAGHVGP